MNNDFDIQVYQFCTMNGLKIISREDLRTAMSAVYNQKGGPRITLEDVLFGPEEQQEVIEAEVVKSWEPAGIRSNESETK